MRTRRRFRRRTDAPRCELGRAKPLPLLCRAHCQPRSRQRRRNFRRRGRSVWVLGARPAGAGGTTRTATRTSRTRKKSSGTLQPRMRCCQVRTTGSTQAAGVDGRPGAAARGPPVCRLANQVARPPLRGRPLHVPPSPPSLQTLRSGRCTIGLARRACSRAVATPATAAATSTSRWVQRPGQTVCLIWQQGGRVWQRADALCSGPCGRAAPAAPPLPEAQPARPGTHRAFALPPRSPAARRPLQHL